LTSIPALINTRNKFGRFQPKVNLAFFQLVEEASATHSFKMQPSFFIPIPVSENFQDHIDGRRWTTAWMDICYAHNPRRKNRAATLNQVKCRCRQLCRLPVLPSSP